MKLILVMLGMFVSGNLLANQVCAQYKSQKTGKRDWFFCYTCPESNTRSECPQGILTDCVNKNMGVSFTSMRDHADTYEQLDKQQWRFTGNCTIKSGRANPYIGMGLIIQLD